MGEYPASHSAVQGALNYVEGQTSINGQSLDAKPVGVTALGTGELLTTGNGRAEFLLTPAFF